MCKCLVFVYCAVCARCCKWVVVRGVGGVSVAVLFPTGDDVNLFDCDCDDMCRE